MKVILSVHHFPPNYSAGAEVYTFRLASWLINHGYDVEVVCIESITSSGTSELEHTHEIFEGISVWRLYFNINNAQDRFHQSFENPLIGEWFKEFLQHQSPDIVHINSCYLLSVSTIQAAKQLSLPTIATLHDFWFVCPRIILLKPTGEVCTVPENPTECVWCLATEKRRFRWLHKASNGAINGIANIVLSTPIGETLLNINPNTEKIALRRNVLMHALNQVDYILSPSQFLRDIFVQQGVNPEKIGYSRISLDTSYWEVPDQMPSSSPDVLRISYIGQIAPDKGVHILIEAFNKLTFTNRKAHLKIYGDPSKSPKYVNKLHKIIQDNSNVEFAGRFDNKKVAKILSDSDITVTPSIWYENSPITIMEALTTGTPVIAANLGGMPELVQHNVNGLLFEAGNADDLAIQIQKLLDNPTLLDTLAKQAKLVRTIDDEMAYITELYQQVTNHKN